MRVLRYRRRHDWLVLLSALVSILLIVGQQTGWIG